MLYKELHLYIERDFQEITYNFRDKETNRLIQFIDPVSHQAVMQKEVQQVAQQLLKMAKALNNYGFFERESPEAYFTVCGNVFVESDVEVDFLVDQDLRMSNTPFKDESIVNHSPTWHSFSCYFQNDGNQPVLRDKQTHRRFVFSQMPTNQITKFYAFLNGLEQLPIGVASYNDPDSKETICLEGTVIDETETEIYLKFDANFRYFLV